MDNSVFNWWASHRWQDREPSREDLEDMDHAYLERLAQEAADKGLTKEREAGE